MRQARPTGTAHVRRLQPAAIRALIRQLIGAENVKTPLTDSKIANLLGDQGIIVARRTVAKYREALQIPPVNLRKAA